MCISVSSKEGGRGRERDEALLLGPTKSLAMLVSMVPTSDERRLGIRRIGGRDGKRH